jgi:3-isopropylmalate/(R)-2-methylmalate dehydratase small subunit
MNQPIEIIEGRAIPLPRADVDTDQIIPARHLARTVREGFGRFAFEEWRADPDFVLNDPRYRGAPIMVAGPNFGCGSSREHAPWALHDLGLRALIAPSFADIFAHNAVGVGLLTIELPAPDHEAVIDRATRRPDEPWTVDLPRQRIVPGWGGGVFAFEIDAHVKHRLLRGLDPIGVTLEHAPAIDAYEARRSPELPRTTAAPRR